ncbi:hypothetical protein B7463_g7477, partial [Scytalidium lignicola]
MLDSNLPTFYIKPSPDAPLSNTIYFSQDESELQPQYTLRRPDPKLPASKNCYAIALYDSYNPEVLYAEVLVQPEWQQPTLSAAEIRAQNGVPAPLVPIVPNNFIIQLYNPDQQVTVRQIAGSWNSSSHWEFEMPQTSFRQPSASMLDRSQDDPPASDITPKVPFKWKRDGKLSKDITCFLVGKSSDTKKNKEPDIPIAMFKGSKTLTLYQPNMHRVDLEDFKGLEVVILLGASVIKDIFFNPNREMFNINAPTATRKNSGTVIPPKSTSPVATMSGAIFPVSKVSTSPTLDPETARLKAQIEAEEKDRERAARQEERRLKKMLEQEEKERRRREAEVEKETERLKKIYGVPPPLPSRHPQQQAPPPSQPPRPQASPYVNQPPYSRTEAFPQYYSAPHSRPPPVQRPVSTPANGPLGNFDNRASISNLSNLMGGSNAPPPQKRPHRHSGPYLQPPNAGNASSSGFFSSSGSNDGGGYFGFGRNKLTKKKSVFF